VLAHKPRELLVFIPQTDDVATAWIHVLAQHPKLRLVMAMSPRFHRFEKDPALKAQVVALEKSNRVELALQLPNAPFLPLLIDTNSAKDALPQGSSLPASPFAYADDVIQIVARAKADFYRTWNVLPRGLVLPYGAASPQLFALFDRLGIAWLVAALEAPPVDGPWRSGSLMVWDGTPAGQPSGTSVQVWDERISKEKGVAVLERWARNLEQKDVDAILPSDSGLEPQPLPDPGHWYRRTWLGRGWETWIGSPAKNDAWEWLRKTREALESYKNSGQASVKRLDTAYEEMFTAENANYFASIGSETPGAADREHEFKASLAAVYRLAGKPPPEDLFSSYGGAQPAVLASSTTVTAETLPDGREHVVIEDASGDYHGDGQLPDPPGGRPPGIYDLRRLEVLASSQTLEWIITLASSAAPSLGEPHTAGPLIDIYVDLNGQPYVGTPVLLAGRGLSAAPADAWEYALSLNGTAAWLYRTQSGGTYEAAGTFSLVFEGNNIHITLPREIMRGSPRRWGYQVLTMAYDQRSPQENAVPLQAGKPGSHTPPVYDLIDPLDMPQSQLLADIEEGRRSDIPFIRVKKK